MSHRGSGRGEERRRRRDYRAAHQRVAGALEDVAQVLAGTRLPLLATDEAKMIVLFDTLCEDSGEKESGEV